MKARKRGKSGKRPTALDQLLVDARQAGQNEISSRRTAVEDEGVWPTARHVSDTLERLARTSDEQREAFRQRTSYAQRLVLAAYGGYSAIRRSLVERSPERLRLALVARALGSGDEDPRDWMLSASGYHYAAGRLGLPAADLFDEAATYAPRNLVTLFQGFGRRTDITAGSWPGVCVLVEWENSRADSDRPESDGPESDRPT